jgi:3',5'-cyclic AMP phosphodiesterase CpdA
MKHYLKILLLVCCVITTLLHSLRLFATNQQNDNDINTYNSIVLLGDTQRTMWVEFWREQNDSIRVPLFESICQKKPALVVHLGDMVDWGASTSAWSYFDEVSSCLTQSTVAVKDSTQKRIPFIAVMGNHDYYGSNSSCLENARKRFPNLQSTTYGCVVIDSVAILYLDSNFDELSDEYKRNQLRWLDSTLLTIERRNDIKVSIACWHHPAFTNSDVVDDDKKTQEDFVERLLTAKKVRLIASGHAHRYEHFTYNKRHFLVSGGGGGPRQDEKVNKRHNRGDTVATLSSKRLFQYCSVVRKGSNLHVTVYGYQPMSASFTPVDVWQTE